MLPLHHSPIFKSFALPDSNWRLPPSRGRAVHYTKPILRSIVPTNYSPCTAFIFSIVQRHLLTLCRCVRRAGKQNRTAILGLEGRCTNRCAIPAIALLLSLARRVKESNLAAWGIEPPLKGALLPFGATLNFRKRVFWTVAFNHSANPQ